MDYSLDSHSYKKSSRSKHDSFLHPSSHDFHGNSRHSRSSIRLDVPSNDVSMSRNKSIHERERRPYHHGVDHRSRSSVRREETYPAFSERARSTRRQNTWPPNPSVEDEDEALAKEFPKRRSTKEREDEVRMPGTPDQDPVLIELENHDRRFVLVPQDETRASRRESKSARRRSELLPLKMDASKADLFTRRQPSPYAFSASQAASPKRNSAELLTLSTPDIPRNSSSASISSLKSDRQPQSRNCKGSSDERQTDDSDLEPAVMTRLRNRKFKPRVSFTGPAPPPQSRPEIKRFSTSPIERQSKPATSCTGILKSAMKVPRSLPTSDDEKPGRNRAQSSSSKAGPIPIPIPQHVRAESVYSGRPNVCEFVAETRANESACVPTPSVSLKFIDRTSTGGYYASTKPSSRPSSPTMLTFEARDFANQASRAPNDYNNGDRANRSINETRSRDGPSFDLSARQSSFERTVGNGKGFPATPSTLPYPVDDHMFHMPNPEHYIDTPTTPSVQTKSSWPSFGIQDSTASPVSIPNPSKRPPTALRPPIADNVTLTSRTPATASRLHTTTSRTPATSRDTLVLPTSLPVCPRMEYSKKYDDWYTLRADQAFDICPNCLDGIVWLTHFQSEFIPSPRRATTTRTRCDFASPWVRLAWLLTLKRQRQDLDLIYALSAIASVDSSCPDAREGTGPWYGLLGEEGQFIPGFAICSCDMKYIEACFPSLIGLLSRMPPSSSGPDAGMCSMRISGKMFPTYLDLLEDIDEEARAVPLRSSPSLQVLIKIVRADSPKKRRTECTRDNLIHESTWHFIPALPEFTVCEVCFDGVIWPTIKQGSDVAERFNKVLMPLPAGVGTAGASCQVYSPRMQKIWERAVKYGDKEGLNYLARKVRERREVEDDLRRQQREIGKLLERNKKLGGGSDAAVQKERLKRELGGIELEWADWE